MTIQKGDFIKINYTGKIEDGNVFDTTIESVAKTHHLQGKRSKYAPIIVCVGERHLIPGLDDALIGRSTGKFTVTIAPDKAFGKKDAKLLKIVPTAQLLQQKIRPQPGLELNIDGSYGVVRSVSGGRTIVDFNHPLASRDVSYDVEIVGIVDDLKEQATGLLDVLGIPHKEVSIEGKHVIIKTQQLFPKPIMDILQEKLKNLTGATAVSFEAGERKKEEIKAEA